MTIGEYYRLIAEAWKSVDETNLEEIRAYNEHRRQLRKLVDFEEEQPCHRPRKTKPRTATASEA